MNLTLIKAVIKARRNGLLRLRPANEPTRVDCLMDACAKCCMNLGSPVVTQEEGRHIAPEFLHIAKDATFVRSEDCACCLLKKGLCSIYQYRPRGCAEYPWYNIDGELYYDSGCPGIRHDLDERPDVNDIQPFSNFFGDTPAPVLWVIKKVCIRTR